MPMAAPAIDRTLTNVRRECGMRTVDNLDESRRVSGLVSDDLRNRLGPFDTHQFLMQPAVEIGQAIGVEAELVQIVACKFLT